ncbi:molybdenum cofactor biosynthesis protein MoaE [Sphingomonas sp. CGMCC 1.13654]|uniref:Molybdopterin synthase catalytic subunit n=1 Tax=Sphingomonas chungangi TaxID=2683589 RepID=A0A838LA55_9SPHN|nr:molybdenum cofactor biosynthesis protein MoaE [Sphingomonas chungangi]MBA2936141.1 molybdenum cofactor biosynthesis protein MoaE [Sphingomonas chungangi]MVW55527.1 molybdopterin synthase catalytic subunit [Sphingomonas chungangi]
MSARVAVQEADFDLAAEFARLEALGGGGVASFTGVVRGGEGLTALRLEAYPGMTGRALDAIAAQAITRWSLLGCTLIHRHGTLSVGERIVLVGTAARHRAAALEACAFLIDWAKTKAPLWKQEIFADGSSRWVEPRAEDDAAAAEWDASAEHGKP